MLCSLILDALASTLLALPTDSAVTQRSVDLHEVTVSAPSRKVEDQGGKIVYNAYLEKVRTDVTAMDLLRKVPMVTVDANGNVSVRGHGDVKILVNGHSPGMLSASQVLYQISPADIMKVEVMTTPDARYEAQGSGGVLNIILRRKVYFKSSGYLNAGVGTKGSHLMGNFSHAMNDAWTMQNTFYGLIGYAGVTSGNNYSADDVDGDNVGQLYSYSFGVSRTGGQSQLDLGLQYLYQGMSYKETRAGGARQKSNNGYHYASAAVDYNLRLHEKATMDFQTRLYFLPTYNHARWADTASYKSGSDILGLASQLDFTFRPSRGLTLDAGVSNSLGHLRHRYLDQDLHGLENLGLYAEMTYEATPLLSLKSGLRYEYYHIHTRQDRKKAYADLFYNLGVNYKVTPFSTASVSFSRRTNRPSYATLLSDVNYQGGGVFSRGNNAAEPSYSYLLEGGWSLYAGECFLKLSPYYRYEDRPISLLTRMDNGMLGQTAANLDSAHSWGVDLWATVNLWRGRLNFNGGLDMERLLLRQGERDNRGWQFQYIMNATWRIMPTLYVNCYGTWQNKRVYVDGRQSSYLYSNLSIQKSWHDDHYRVALSIDNPFSDGVTIKREFRTDKACYSSWTKYHNTGIRVFFVYKFGKHDMESNMKVKKNFLDNN